MKFKRTQVGFDRYGRSLMEYHLEGTTLVVCRMNPETNRGWVIFDEALVESRGDAWRLEDAKMLAVRYAEQDVA